MQDQLKTLRSDSKGKGSSTVSAATEELRLLVDFNGSITQSAAKAMEHLTDFVFISIGNFTLACRDAYLSHLQTGIKPDTLNALRTAPLKIAKPFPDAIIKKAEEDIAQFESKGHTSAAHGKGRYHPYERPNKRSDTRTDTRSDKPAWNNIGKRQFKAREARVVLLTIHPDQPRASSPINDNYCVKVLQTGLLAGSKRPKDSCKLCCCKSCTYCTRAFAKEKCKSRRVRLLSELQIKICERCFLYRSIVFCKTCNKCPTCCLKSTCTVKLLKKLVGSGCQSESSSDLQRGLHPPLSDPAKLGKISQHHKLLCQSSQELLPVGGITSAYGQKRSRSCTQSKISGVFQLTIFGIQTQQQVDTYTRSEQFKPISQGAKIQNGDTGNHQDIP